MSEKGKLDYFNLDSRARAAQEQVAAVISPAHISIIRQIVMYIGVFVGILFSTAVSQLQSEEAISMAMNAGRIIVSAIVAFMIVPQVYQRLNPESPFIVQFGVFVQNGVFWSVAIDLIRETL